jgi:hypothetical protein
MTARRNQPFVLLAEIECQPPAPTLFNLKVDTLLQVERQAHPSCASSAVEY